jgi:hypothetical protein
MCVAIVEETMKILFVSSLALLLLAPIARPASASTANDDLARRIVEREQQTAADLGSFHPLVETYIQVQKAHDGELAPWYDRHFLSVAEFHGELKALRFKPRHSEIWRGLGETADSFTPVTIEYNPSGFVAMAYPNPATFDLRHYHLESIGSEYLGDVRCLVFHVSPIAREKKGLFEGKIWVESQTLVIVRFNGAYDGTNIADKYVHFDSWRANAKPGLWVPAAIYADDEALPCCGAWKINWTKIHMRSETRFWGYGLHLLESSEEAASTSIEKSQQPRVVASAFSPGGSIAQPLQSTLKSDEAAVQDLERLGLLAPIGEVETGLQNVLASFQAANHLSFAQGVQCRVLLTSNLESAVIGHTIILSRGILELMPNQAALAAILAHGLAHVALEDAGKSNLFAGDQSISDPREVTRKLRVAHSAKEEAQAASLAQEWMRKSPYGESLASVSEFAAQLKTWSPRIGKLLEASIGENLCQTLGVDHMRAAAAVQGLESSFDRFPFGGKLNVDPWSGALLPFQGKANSRNADTASAPLEIAPVAMILGGGPATNSRANR